MINNKILIFALPIPTTPLNDAYHGGTSFLYTSMKYIKRPLDLPQQLDILKQRGLTISDEEMALEQLHSISYFRLANYWRQMEKDI